MLQYAGFGGDYVHGSQRHEYTIDHQPEFMKIAGV